MAYITYDPDLWENGGNLISHIPTKELLAYELALEAYSDPNLYIGEAGDTPLEGKGLRLRDPTGSQDLMEFWQELARVKRTLKLIQSI